ncbi:MAG: Ig-like domain-containing protein, partial [Flavobacteriales bacterium]|nr:Ig-like domain-containing protein [Flavobacteriales bacterium]
MILLVTVVSCAQQQAPTGGPKDTAPPRIISSNPQNFSTGFNEDFIELEFNEFVQLKGIQKQMIISPPLKEKLDIKTKGKSVRLPMPKSLKPNVTYVINFGEGITDITEFNPLDSNLFVFSTGDFIDSLKIRGKVKDAKSLKPLDAILVMLYEENIDSLPYQIKPTYVGKS